MNKKYLIKRIKITPVDALLHQLFTNDYEILKRKLPGKFLYIFQITRAEQISWQLHKTIGHFNKFAQQLHNKIKIPLIDFGQETTTPQQEILVDMESFLNKIIQIPQAILMINQFIEQSDHQYQGFSKYGEIKMWKKAGGRYAQSIFKCKGFFGNWKIRHFILTDGGILYKDQSNIIKEYIAYDQDFKIESGKQVGNQKSISVITSHRKLILQALDFFDCMMFVYHVQRGLKNCEYTNNNRFSSFAPIRRNCQAQLFIDSQNYLKSLAQHIQNAKKQIFIAGWWLSPQFHLIRPGDHFRVDKILQRAAARNVKINILVYKQSKFLQNDSKYTKQKLQSLSPNIKVIRHPQTVLPFLWSHHQKLVIIDQTIGFIGGIDLCYGRYDNNKHDIFGSQQLYPGIQYNNMRNRDINDVRNFQATHYPRNNARLPWHDIAVCLKGRVVWDLSRHFIQYWNHAGFQIQFDKRQILIHDKKHENLKDKIQQSLEKFKQFTTKIKLKFQKQQNKQHRNTKLEQYIKQFTPAKYSSNQKQKVRKTHSMLYNQKSNDSVKLDEEFYQILRNLNMENQKDQQNSQNQSYTSQIKKNFQQDEPLVSRHDIINTSKKGRSQCQIVRSVGPWSVGSKLKNKQLSIQIAYLQLINRAQHYIYIQNQFFISSCADPQNIKNSVVLTLAARIRRAHRQKQTFKVYILLPLLPGFAGNVEQQSSIILRLQLHWQYQRINRGKQSFLKLLAKDGITNYGQYVQFLSLRTHGRLRKISEPLTQIIYIHSKLMIIDDQFIIVGSANINDRSMNGQRDSQLCVVISDQQLIKSRMGGKNMMVSKKALQLRLQLFKEHFNLNGVQQADPILQSTWYEIKRRAQKNTLIYREVFGCYPDNQIKNMNEISQLKKNSKIQLYDEKIKQIIGNVVQFPIYFLRQQKLNLKMNQKEYLLPVIFAT